MTAIARFLDRFLRQSRAAESAYLVLLHIGPETFTAEAPLTRTTDELFELIRQQADCTAFGGRTCIWQGVTVLALPGCRDCTADVLDMMVARIPDSDIAEIAGEFARRPVWADWSLRASYALDRRINASIAAGRDRDELHAEERARVRA